MTRSNVVTKKPTKCEALAARGFVVAYADWYDADEPGGEVLRRAYPRLFIKIARQGVWCHRPGEAMLAAIRRVVSAANARRALKSLESDAIKREAASAIKYEFSEVSVYALVHSAGIHDAMCTIAKRAEQRMEAWRTGMEPKS
jgi:hypothetical protein